MMGLTSVAVQGQHFLTMARLNTAIEWCKDNFFVGWNVSMDRWPRHFPVGLGARCRRNNSGLLATHDTRAYTGKGLLWDLPADHAATCAELLMHVLSMNSDISDEWTYIWGSNVFSCSKAYKFMIGHRTLHQAFGWTWRSSCQNKHKVFFWLLLRDRLSTRENLHRRGMHLESYNCVLCLPQTEECVFHLFLGCPFAQEAWSTINLQIPFTGDPFEILSSFKQQLNCPFYMEIIILMSWSISMVRNDLIFRNIQPDIAACRRFFKKELALVVHRAKSRIKPFLQQWIESHL